MGLMFKITDMVCAEEVNGKQKVVSQIEFVASNETTGKSSRGQLAVSTVDLSKFIEFENLTEQNVIAWVVNSLQEAGVYDELVVKLNETQEEAIVHGLPWTV